MTNTRRIGAGARVYLVGAGPGALDLLTLRAARLLEAADIVFYDALANPEMLKLAPNAKLVAVGKRHGRHSTAQTFINKQLVDAAKKYTTVVRLKGGDPMLFGRAQEEIDALTAAGIEVEVVPGITAALAASASLKVSLTRRGIARHVAFVTPRIGTRISPRRPGAAPRDIQSASPCDIQNASTSNTEWLATAVSADTAVIYMGAGEAESIAQALIARGRPADTPVALIENASLASERRWLGRLDELAGLARALNGGPAIIVLGEVLAERGALQALSALPAWRRFSSSLG